MTELEKCNAGLEYSYADEELVARKGRAIRWCEEYNAINGEDYDAQYAYLQKMLGGVGERVWIAKTFNCDCGKNIFAFEWPLLRKVLFLDEPSGIAARSLL